MSVVKEEAKKLIEALPESGTGDDVLYQFVVKDKLRDAFKEAAEGEVVSHVKAKEQLSASM